MKAFPRLALAVMVLAGCSASTVACPHRVAAHSAGVWSNVTAFTTTCKNPSSEPAHLASLARTGLTFLGYSIATNAVGPSFTKSEFLADYPAKFAVYVHSHGDVYWDLVKGGHNVDSAFLEDAGTCAGKRVLASAIKAASQPPYNIVIMSACRLGWDGKTPDGYLANNMPGAFGFAYNATTGRYTQTSTSKQFYIAYRYYTYDSDQDTFETAFWQYVQSRNPAFYPTLLDAFTYALNSQTYSTGPSEAYAYAIYSSVWKTQYANPFTPIWFGNPYYRGEPG